jgi:lactam utilization protein B
MSSAVQEGKFLSQLLEDMVKIKFTPVTLHRDNQGALALAKNPVQHQRSKHIDIRYHFVRSEVRRCLLQLLYVTSKDNLAS